MTRSGSGGWRFIYDTEITVDIGERVDDIETEIIADYSGRTEVQCDPEFVPAPQGLPLSDGEFWAYLRHEPTELP